ncbi:MAG: DUF1573 domain-containing protein [Planctomycetota bacterium]
MLAPTAKNRTLSRLAAIVSAVLVALTSCGPGNDADRPDDWAGPWLFISESSHDFGPMFATETQRHAFRLENRGRKTLVIGRIKKDCGCAKPSLDRHEIPAGESATLTLDFKPPVIGYLEKRIWIYSNDPYADPSLIKVKAQGYGLARLEPAVLRLEGEFPIAGIERVLELHAAEGESLKDVRFLLNSPFMSIEPLGPKEGQHLRYRFRMFGIRESLSLRESIPVTFRLVNAGVNGRLTVPFQVLGEVHPTVTVDPPSVSLRGAPGTVVETMLTLKATGPAKSLDFVARIEGEGADGFTSVVPIPSPESSERRYRLRLTIPSNKARNAARCVFEVANTDLAIAVPVQGYAMRLSR